MGSGRRTCKNSLKLKFISLNTLSQTLSWEDDGLKTEMFRGNLGEHDRLTWAKRDPVLSQL